MHEVSHQFCISDVGTYSQGIAHLLLVERRIDDKVAVVADDRARLHLRHAKLGICGAEGAQVMKNLRVGKGSDLHWDALLPLKE